MSGRTEDRHIRVVALGVVRREAASASEYGEELLVSRHRDPTGEPFYRPLGGGVEFGEPSETALRREFREELDVELTGVSYIDTYEDVFTAEGRTHHELWRLYEVDIAEEWPYDEDEFTAREPELDEEIRCVWKPVADFAGSDGSTETGDRVEDDGETFYPEALLADL